MTVVEADLAADATHGGSLPLFFREDRRASRQKVEGGNSRGDFKINQPSYPIRGTRRGQVPEISLKYRQGSPPKIFAELNPYLP
ncbi:hypothetical protein, partial [Arenibaculum sp.]|uniref:hypothetical protein n=1 Tax=Arenibaculum sp. TaxID=2865862 RepID=UPI002E0F419F|nr:hypothetical protein [Arenibaculum sp.]